MLTLLKDYKGELEVNGKHYNSIQKAISSFTGFSGSICIKLPGVNKNVNKAENSTSARMNNDSTQYKITVKAYMTKKASPDFDFMSKWNNDNPMPLRTMTGTIEKQTKGMVYMKLHAVAEQDSVYCMRCGRPLTNPISMKYGIGPECITHVPFLAQMAMEDVEGISLKMHGVRWEGWIIKSAIIEQEVVK